MKALVKEFHCLALSAFVCLFLTHQDFKLLGKQSANGGFPPGRNDLGLANCLAIKTDGTIRMARKARNSKMAAVPCPLLLSRPLTASRSWAGRWISLRRGLCQSFLPRCLWT